MLAALRAELRTLLSAVPSARPAVLRRSDRADMLLACDLPLAADEQAAAAFTQALTARGWTVLPQAGWLLLDKPVPVPAVPDAIPTLIGELGCVLSLLRRHPDDVCDEQTVRAVVKAAEQGAPALERLCKQLHADWAEALRLGRPLPGRLLPYLIQAAKEVYP